MSEPYYTYGICSICVVRRESPASLGTKLVNTLDALSRIDPLCANWRIIDAHAVSSSSLAAVRSRIADIFENNVARDDVGGADPDFGYYVSARTKKDNDARNVRFGVEAGGIVRSNTRLEFGDYKVPPDQTIITYPRFKAALLAINAAWQPQYAFAYAHRVGSVLVPIKLGSLEGNQVKGVPQVPGDPTFPDDFYIPWIFYLSAPFAAGLKVTSEIQTERTADGGLLMSAAEDRLDPTNPAHIRRARVLAEALIACRGYASNKPSLT